MTQAVFVPTTRRSEVKITKRNANRIREEWVRAVEKLIGDAAQWAGEVSTWETTLGIKEIEEDKLGRYTVPTLKIRIDLSAADTVYEIALEPLERNSWRGEGQVLLSAYPTVYQLRLFRQEATEKWHIHTNSGVDWPFLWDRDVFFDLINRLVHSP